MCAAEPGSCLQRTPIRRHRLGTIAGLPVECAGLAGDARLIDGACAAR